MPRFNKPALSIPDLLEKWKSRGLEISHEPEAQLYLRFIGYYRFSAYAHTFQQIALADKPFIPKTSFQTVLDLYRFDRELRLLVMDAIERIEVAVRACFVNETSIKWGPHWYMDSNHFGPSYHHPRLLEKIERELGIPRGTPRPRKPVKAHQERFINHYYSTYGDPDLPPIWMICECLSLGTWSLMYANLAKGPDRQQIAQHFGLNEAILTNWLHVLSYVRNICAHHQRLWNRQLVIKLRIAKKHKSFLAIDDRFYALAVVIHELLQIISPGNQWHSRLESLLVNYSVTTNQSVMGFPAGWNTQPFWNVSKPI